VVDLRRARRLEIGGIAVLTALAALALVQSWQRWLDPLIDTGRDLYIPEQLAQGAKLYRDIRYQYPPLAPYLLALIGGHSLASYIAIGIAQSFAAASTIYLAARKVAGKTGAFGATLLFIALNMTNASTWGVTWIFPYSYAATFGMTLLLIAVASLLYERPAIAMAALVLASWCKIELAFAAAVIVIGLTLTRRLAVRYAAAFGASMAVIFGALAFYFRDTQWLTGNLFASSLTKGEVAHTFFARVSGTANWPSNVGSALFGVGVIAAIALLIRIESPLVAPAVLVIALTFGDERIIRAFGLLQWVVLFVSIRDRSRPLFLLSLFSIVTTLRVALNVSPGWYGFTLVIPIYILLVAFLRRPIWLLLIGAIAVRGLCDQHQRYAMKQYPIVSSRGTFYDANEDRAAILTQFLQRVHGGTLVVIPEGITLDYLGHATTPLTYHTFTPVETDDPRVEQEITHEMALHPPERIALVDREVREFGYRGFGVDYNLQLAAWIQRHYRGEVRWRGSRFYLVLLHRL
jgi:hypothetical protein